MSETDYASARPQQPEDHEDGVDVMAFLAPAVRRWKAVVGIGLLAGAAAVGGSYMVTPKFTAASVFLPPHQQNSASAALASLGALSGLAGVGANKNVPDEYIALMQSATVSDRIIQKFDLKKLWNQRFQVDTRKRLLRVVHISAGKKDGLMRVEVTDPDPVRAAAMANQYVEELRTLTTTLAVSEAQQRRAFFERLLEETRDKLANAQSSLETSGFTAGALNAEPQSAAQGYARIQAELTAAKVKLQVLRTTLADGAPEVRTQQETANALASQLAKLEAQNQGHTNTNDYVNRYREFKYQETLFTLFARQYENARVDESREGALIQMLDPATPPERKSAPGRSTYGFFGTLLGMLLAGAFVTVRHHRALGR